MKNAKKALLIGVILVVIGCVVGFVGAAIMGFDFSSLSGETIERQTEIIDTVTTLTVVTKSCPVEVKLTDGNSYVVFSGKESTDVSILTSENKLLIWVTPTDVFYDNSHITVYLKSDLTDVKIESTSGDVTVGEGFALDSASLSSSSGEITLSSDAKTAKLNTTSGKVKTNGVRIGEAEITATSGRTLLEKSTLGKLTVTSTSGLVEAVASDADEINITTTSGSVKLELLSGKHFDIRTSSGRVTAPESTDGGECVIRTASGNVTVTVK